MPEPEAPSQPVAPVSPQLFAYLATDPVAELLGIVFEEIHPGYARARMPVTHRLLNAPGTAHGGAMMALIDVVHAAVSNSHGTLAVAQDVHTEFLSAGTVGDVLMCAGEEISRTQRTAVYRIDVHAVGRPSHPDGKLLATALARVFRIGTPLPIEPSAVLESS
ncbi:MAG: hotdog fold thioesterase [Candidatus Phosphoribacter sp.]|nr:hotdog fold thioesterase [Actinomycetales bacterium]